MSFLTWFASNVCDRVDALAARGFVCSCFSSAVVRPGEELLVDILNDEVYSFIRFVYRLFTLQHQNSTKQ